MKKLFSFYFILLLSACCIYAQHTIRIELKTDYYGSETTWTVKNMLTDEVIASGGPYTNVSRLIDIPEITVDGMGCYSFSIFDYAEDGICCSYGTGYYKVYYDNVLEKEGGDFSKEDHVYGMGEGCRVNDIELTKIYPASSYVEVGENISVEGSITNWGTSTLTSFDVRYRIANGEFSTAYTQTCNIGIGETATFQHDIPAVFPEELLYNFTVEVLNPNEQNDENDTNNILTGKVQAFTQSTQRKVLLESFYTESSEYAPDAITAIENLLQNKESDVIWIGHHAGYYSDRYTITANTDLLSFYNSNSTYVPAVMTNRAKVTENAPGPVFNPSDDLTDALLNSLIAKPAIVDINISGDFHPQEGLLEIVVSGELYTDLLEEYPRLTVYLLEDSLESTTQSGYNGTYIHNNVPRVALSANTGDQDILTSRTKGTTYSKTYQFNLANSLWNTDNMRIVAFLHNWDPGDVNNREVLNATQIAIPEIGIYNADITSFSFGNLDDSPAIINAEDKTISITVEGTDRSNLIAEFELSPEANAQIAEMEQISGVTVNDFTNPVIYRVTSKNNKVINDWTVTVSTSGSNNLNETSLGNINLYPNPAKNILNIENVEDAKVSILNLTGNNLLTRTNCSEKEQFDISFLTSGMYFVAVSKEDKTQTYKVVIDNE